MNKTFRTMAALALAGTLATGCGSESGGGAAHQADTTVTTPGSDSAPSTPSTPSTPAASDTAATAAIGGHEACGFATFIEESEGDLNDVFDPAVAPAERKEIMQGYVAELAGWATVMPAEIAPDFESVAASITALDEVLAANDYDFQAILDDPTAFAAFQEEAAASETDEGQEAEDRLDAWFLDNCGVDLNADDTGDGNDDGEEEEDPLAGARLPFDPCTVPAMVELSALVDVDLTDGSSAGTSRGDGSVVVSCGWTADDGSLLAISSIAYIDAAAAASDIRITTGFFGGKAESLDDRYPAPAFAIVFDELVTVYVLGTDAPFGVSFTRTVPDGDPKPDLETTYAIADALVAGLEPVPGGLDLPVDESADDIEIDAEPFDSANVVYPFDPCDAVTSAAVTNLVDTGGQTTSSGSGSQSYHASESCGASGTTAAGTVVEVTIVALAFDDAAAARAELINSSDGETDADLSGLPDGSFATVDGFWGDSLWVLDAATPFGVRVVVADSDPKENDLVLAAEIARAFIAE